MHTRPFLYLLVGISLNRYVDPEQFRLPVGRGGDTPHSPSPTTKLPRHKPGEKFLKGPIPWNWLAKAATQPGKALHVALTLWFLAGMKRSRTVSLATSYLSMLGVNRFAGYRGLKTLERVGLVSVVRHRGRQPMVTILEVVAESTL